MAESLVNGDADNSVQTALLTVVNAAGMLEANFDTSTDMEGDDPEKVKRKSHHAEIEKRRKSKLNEGINKLIEILPDRDAKRSKVQILEDTYNLVVELQKKCNQLMIQNAPESEVDEIKRLMEENAKLKKEKEDWTEFFRSMNINTDIRTHMKAVLQSKSKKNSKFEPPSDQLLGGSQNIIIQSPTNTVMGSPNLMTMPTNQMTIPIASGNRLDGNLLQGATNPGGMLLVTTSRAGQRESQPSVTLTNNQVSMVSNERPEAEGQSPLPKAIGEAVENQSVPATSQEGMAIAAITCTHEASNQNSMAPVNTTTAESKNTTAVTQVISTPITTPASQNQVLLQSGTGGVRLVQQQPVQSQSQTVLIQLPGQPGQFIPVRIAPQVNQPQQVILTSQQGVNVIGTRGSAIQPKTPVKKKQPPQLKVKNICPLQPDSRKPNSPIASQSSVQPIAPNTVTVRLPMNPTANQQSTVMMNNQGQLILQQPSNTVLPSGMNMQMPVQVVPKPPVTQNIVYIQQNGQLIPVILQQNQGNVQQGVQQQTGAIIQGQQQQPQQQNVKMQASQNLNTRLIQSSAGTIQSTDNQVSASTPIVSSGISQSAPSTTSQALDGASIPASSSSKVVSNSYQPNDLMNPLAIETPATHNCDQGRMQGGSDFAANDILAKATESIFSQSETSPMQIGDLHDSQAHTANQSVIKTSNGLFSHQTTQPGLEIYDLPDDMDTSSSKSKHKKKKKKKSKSKEKEKKKKDKDKDKDKEKSKKINFPLPTVASSNNNADVSDAQEMATEALIESLMQGTLGAGGVNQSNNADSVLKSAASTSMASDIPVSANGSVQMSSFSAESLLSSGTRDALAGSQRESTQVSSASISKSESEANGQAIFSAFNDILSNSMSVSGLPTYIDEEEEMVSGITSTEGPPSITSTANEDTPTSLSVVTSINGTQNQPSNSLSLTFSHGTDRMVPPEQKTPDSSKGATTPTSESFHSFMSPTSFPSISSLLEQSSNAEREASISSLPSSSQKDDSPTNGLSGVTGGPFQHSWISHHSKASELARGIQPAKSQSPVSMPTLMSTTSTTLSTSASMAVSTIPSVNTSPPSTLQATNTGNANKSSPSLGHLSQPWLNASTTETLTDATSQPDLRQQQQLADLIQGLAGPKASSSQANTEVLTSTGDVLSSLPKSQPSLESLFGLPPFNENRPTSQSNGDLFQSIASIIDSNKTRTTTNSRDTFPGLPPYSVPTTTNSSSVPVVEQNSGFREPALEQTKEISSYNSSKPTNAPPSYSLMNRVSAVVDKYKEKKVPSAPQSTPKVPDRCDVENNPTSEVYRNVSQQPSRPVADAGSISSTSTNQSRYLHPKSRALASAALQVSPPIVQTSNNIITAQTNNPATQVRQRTGNQKSSNQKKLPVKSFSTATIHRTLTANISEEGGPEAEPVNEPVVQEQPETLKEAPQEPMPFRTVQEPPPQQHLQQQAIVQQVTPPEAPVQQPPAKPKSSKGSKKKQKEKQQVEPPKPSEEDLDSVGRRELDKNLVNRFPWLAEANGKPAGKQAGGLSQNTSNTNQTAFSVQSISQSSSKNPPPKARGSASRTELSQNPPPYPSRTPTVSGDSHNQPLWNPSSLDSNVQVSSSSTMIPPKMTAQDRNPRHVHQSSNELGQQSSSIDTINSMQNRQSTGNNRSAAYQASSSNYVQAAVNAAVSKAAQQALLAKGLTGQSSVPEKNRNASTTKKSAHRPKSGGTSQILKQSDIDDGLDFLNSASNSSTFPTSLSSMDMFDTASVSSSLISRQVDQPSQRSGSSRSRATDKSGRVESSNSSNLLQNDFTNVPQDNFSFTQWNLEPQQTEDRENTRGNSHKMQELASPPMQQLQQRGGNNCVNVNFGDSPNLGSGDDLDFSNLPSFQSSNQQQQQHTPTDRQTPQNQTYSVPSGRSSVASMEPSPHQASPMNYNVQDSSHMSQMNEMPHSNSSSRGPPSVEAPSQQQSHQHGRMTQSPMIQSGHPGQGIKRGATDGHHMNVAKKAHGGMHPGRRGTQQSILEPRQHSTIHTNHQSQVHSNAMQFQSSTAHTPNQSSESIYAGGEVQRVMYPSQSSVRIQDGSRSKKRTQNPSDSIFARDPHEVDGTRSTSISLLQDSYFGGPTRMNTSSSNETATPTFLPNFSSSQTSQSQSESVASTSSTSSLISNISPSRRLRHNEMPTYLPSHLPGPILPSPPQTKGSHNREAADITASFNPMYTPSRTAGIHSVGMPANFPVFHEHQPPGSFNIAKSNQLPGGVTPPFNFNNIFNDSAQMTSSSHSSEAPTLNHSIGLTPTVHLHGNTSEESVLHGNMGQRHAGQHFGLLAQNRPSDVRPQFKMGVPTPMGMPQHFHSPSFMPPY